MPTGADGARYQPAHRYLINPAAWPAHRAAARDRLGLPARADERLEQLRADVDERVAALDRALASGHVGVDLDGGELHVRRLPGLERPEPTSAMAAEIASRLPEADLADVLIDVDRHAAAVHRGLCLAAGGLGSISPCMSVSSGWQSPAFALRGH